jgi:hypothetical protein
VVHRSAMSICVLAPNYRRSKKELLEMKNEAWSHPAKV